MIEEAVNIATEGNTNGSKNCLVLFWVVRMADTVWTRPRGPNLRGPYLEDHGLVIVLITDRNTDHYEMFSTLILFNSCLLLRTVAWRIV